MLSLLLCFRPMWLIITAVIAAKVKTFLFVLPKQCVAFRNALPTFLDEGNGIARTNIPPRTSIGVDKSHQLSLLSLALSSSAIPLHLKQALHPLHFLGQCGLDQIV